MENKSDSYITPTLYEHHRIEDQIRGIEATVQDIPNSSLPGGASGVYYPGFKIGGAGKDLPEPYKSFVHPHEISHAFGTSGDSHGEYTADIQAAARSGHVRFVRGPFYQPPICLN